MAEINQNIKATLILLLFILLLLSACVDKSATSENTQDTQNEKILTKDKNGCKIICDSHLYNTIGIRKDTYQNSVCYCEESGGAIWTFVM